MRGATLFSGIGATEVSAPWVDWRWSADTDDFANAVRAHHWPEVPNLGDVAAIRGPEPVDIIVFGSPCQSFSVAGKRLGLEDPRGNLALVALALVARLRPAWFVFENVPGLLSSDDGRAFGIFLRTVEECGYLGCWRVLDAQYAGVPQRRRRIFFVGYLGDWRPPAAVLFEPESLRWNSPPRREAGQRVARPLASCLDGGSGYRNDADTTDNLIAHSLRAEGFDASEDGTGRGTPLVAFSCKDHGADAGDTSPTLSAMGHGETWPNGGGQVAVAFQERGRDDGRSLEWQADIAYALTSPNGGGRAQERNIAAGPMVRRLTPIECERLQGFPDRWTDIPWRGGRAPDGRRYKALGNAMAVPVIGWVLNRIRLRDGAAA